LHDHRRIRDKGIASDMVEMEMRIDDEINASGIAVDGLQPGANFFTGGEPDLIDAGHSFAEPADGIVLAIWVQPAVEKDSSFRMLDQENRYRHGDPAFGAFHDPTELTFECTTGERVKGNAHTGFLSRVRRPPYQSRLRSDRQWKPIRLCINQEFRTKTRALKRLRFFGA
jgi:hypothetical protein